MEGSLLARGPTKKRNGVATVLTSQESTSASHSPALTFVIRIIVCSIARVTSVVTSIEVIVLLRSASATGEQACCGSLCRRGALQWRLRIRLPRLDLRGSFEVALYPRG